MKLVLLLTLLAACGEGRPLSEFPDEPDLKGGGGGCGAVHAEASDAGVDGAR